jgi:hypothetical protein
MTTHAEHAARWQAVEVRWPNGDRVPMTWYGENLFRAEHDVPSDAGAAQVCARDAAGNEACVPASN